MFSNCFILVSVSVDPEPIPVTLDARREKFTLAGMPVYHSLPFTHTHTPHQSSVAKPPTGMFLDSVKKPENLKDHMNTMRNMKETHAPQGEPNNPSA